VRNGNKQQTHAKTLKGPPTAAQRLELATHQIRAVRFWKVRPSGSENTTTTRHSDRCQRKGVAINRSREGLAEWADSINGCQV